MARYVRINFLQVDSPTFYIYEVFISGIQNGFQNISVSTQPSDLSVIFKTEYHRTKVGETPLIFNDSKGAGQPVTVANNPFTSAKAAKMFIDNGVGTVSVGNTFNIYKGNFVVDFKLTPLTIGGSKGIYLMNADMFPVKILSFNENGYISVGDALYAYQTSNTYSVQFIINTTTEKMDFYLDGIKLLENLDIPIHTDTSLTNWSEGVSGFLVDIVSNGNYNAQMYLDNLMVYEGSTIKDVDDFFVQESEQVTYLLNQNFDNANLTTTNTIVSSSPGWSILSSLTNGPLTYSWVTKNTLLSTDETSTYFSGINGKCVIADAEGQIGRAHV